MCGVFSVSKKIGHNLIWETCKHVRGRMRSRVLIDVNNSIWHEVNLSFYMRVNGPVFDSLMDKLWKV